jgi:hypothetical protein
MACKILTAKKKSSELLPSVIFLCLVHARERLFDLHKKNRAVPVSMRPGGHGAPRAPQPGEDPHYNNATATFLFTSKVPYRHDYCPLLLLLLCDVHLCFILELCSYII